MRRGTKEQTGEILLAKVGKSGNEEQSQLRHRSRDEGGLRWKQTASMKRGLDSLGGRSGAF